jgi:hypothetical protein
MKTPIMLCLLLAAAFVCGASPRQPLTVALLNIETKDDAPKDSGPKLTVLLNALLSADTNIVLVERAELEKALGEQELTLSGAVSSETAVTLGNLVGAKVLITGKAFKVNEDLVVTAKVISTETSRVYSEMVSGPSGALDKLAQELTKKLSATLTARADTLHAKVQSRDDRVQAISKKLKTGKRPAVAIRIPEQHFGSPVADPAAETELGIILQQCGFTLVDSKSARPADIEITGEAFSAFGARRGQMISCKARIELKAHRKSDGSILAIDRQTSVAVDIAEQTAAKTALENAAAELAGRLAPKLIAN